MRENLNLVVMLTLNDKTVGNAMDIYEQNKGSKAEFWGFKEKPLSTGEMKKIFDRMKSDGKRTFLEVVEYTEEEGLIGARIAAECGVDIVMGTKYSDSIHAFCKENGLKYMPFVGKIRERPSILEGTIDEIIDEAKELLKKGVDGFDLLGYRYTGDAFELNRRFVSEVNAPVCIAGSVDSFERLDELREIKPFSFTVGSAFFEKKFGEDFFSEINAVINYVDSGE